MSAKPEKDASPFSGLSYVTAADVWQEAVPCFWVWILFSAVAVALLLATKFGFGLESTGSADEIVVSFVKNLNLPTWLWFPLALAAAGWLVRGKTFSVPNLGIATWIAVSSPLALFIFCMQRAPAWAIAPLFWAYLLGLHSLDNLAKKGRANRRKLSMAGVQSDQTEFEDEN
jgi:hypothetical protein